MVANAVAGSQTLDRALGTLLRIGESDADAALAAAAPRAEKYLGWPMLLWLELAP